MGGVVKFRWIHDAGPADVFALAGGYGARVGCAFDRVGAFHLSEKREHDDGQLQHGVLRVGGVRPDRIGQFPHPHTTVGQVVDEVQGIPDSAARPVQGVHDDHVPVARLVQGSVQSRPIGGRPGFLIHVDAFVWDPLGAQSVDLSVEILFRGRNAGDQLETQYQLT